MLWKPCFGLIDLIITLVDATRLLGSFNLRIDINTRDQWFKIFMGRPRLEVRRQLFSFRVTNPWNSLSDQVVETQMEETFERSLDRIGEDTHN